MTGVRRSLRPAEKKRVTEKALYEDVCNHARETALLASIEALLGWDERTLLPPLGGQYRADQLTYLAGWLHRRRTDPQLGDWLAELSQSPLAEDPHSDSGATIRQLKREYDKRTKIPQKLVEALAKASVLGQRTWVEARANNDFDSFAPVLEEIVALKREQADAIGFEDCRYDALLDDFEPGEKTATVRRVLEDLREQLVPLVAAIGESPRAANPSLLQREFPVAVQES